LDLGFSWLGGFGGGGGFSWLDIWLTWLSDGFAWLLLRGWLSTWFSWLGGGFAWLLLRGWLSTWFSWLGGGFAWLLLRGWLSRLCLLFLGLSA
jgi:hypothetical protein